MKATLILAATIGLSMSWVECPARESVLPPRAGATIDDESAEFGGAWVRRPSKAARFGPTYHFADVRQPGLKTARFVPNLPKAGRYEVRLLYVPHPNRATNVAVEVISADGSKTVTVNQREPLTIGGIPPSLGVFRFAKGQTGAVVVSDKGANGYVVVDAVQFVPDSSAKAERAMATKGLAQPGSLRHSASSPAHLRVEWDDNAEDEDGYRIWRREVGGEWYLAGETGPNATHFDDGGMQERTAYEHRVVAFNVSGEGPTATTPRASETLRMEPHLKPQIVIPANNTNYSSGPGAVKLESGELLLAASQADTANRKSHDGASILLTTSHNSVSDWSEPRLLVLGDTKFGYGKPALVRAPNGSVGLAFTRFTCDDKGVIVGRLRQFMSSPDEGKSWSKPVNVSPSSANNQTLIVGGNGRLLESLSDTIGVNEIFGSDDNGSTWQSLSKVPGKRLGEASLAHVGKGNIVFLSRHEWPFYRLSFSADNGNTWDKRESLLYVGGGDNPPKIVMLPDGTTLAAIVHSWYPGRKVKDRRQLGSVISRDGGRTWDNFRLIGFSPDGTDGFLQHSVAFIDNTAYVFYGGGSKDDTNQGKDLRLLRLDSDFFTSTAPWPYDWRGRPIVQP